MNPSILKLGFQFFFSNSYRKTLRSYDPFEKQKIEAYENSLISATAVAAYTLDQVKKADELSSSDKKIELSKFLRLGLWGNR